MEKHPDINIDQLIRNFVLEDFNNPKPPIHSKEESWKKIQRELNKTKKSNNVFLKWD